MTNDCIFCQIIAGDLPASRVMENAEVIAFLDINPARPGHVLVVPKKHATYIAELSKKTRTELMETGNRIASATRASLGCDDVNFLINDGKHSGQTVPHVHLHVIPRYRGDLLKLIGSGLTRFIPRPLTAAKRQQLDTTASKIRTAFEAIP